MLAFSFHAAAHAAPAPNTKPLPTPVAKAGAPATEETVFFVTEIGAHHVLGRTNSKGTCKAYLGAKGSGWLSYPDPKIDGEDLVAIPGPAGLLALLSTRGGAVNLWLVSADGRDLQALTDDQGGIVPAASANAAIACFSPNGKLLAYVQRGMAWCMDLATRQTRTLASEKDVKALAWSADGQWLGIIADDSVHKVAADGQPDVLLAASGCGVPALVWQDDQVYFYGLGIRRVTAQRHVDLLMPSSLASNNLSLLPGNKEAVLLAPTSAGGLEVFRASLGGGKAALTQVTQGGAEAAWASPAGGQIYFLRDHSLWRCDLDGGHSKPLGADAVGRISIGPALPLAGVCP